MQSQKIARPRPDADRRLRHRGPRQPPACGRRRGHALTADSSVSKAASELPSSRPRCPTIRSKEHVFRHWIQGRPFRRDEVHRLPQKCAVFIGPTARSQARLPRNCNTHGHLTTAVAPAHRKMGPPRSGCKRILAHGSEFRQRPYRTKGRKKMPAPAKNKGPRRGPYRIDGI